VFIGLACFDKDPKEDEGMKVDAETGDEKEKVSLVFSYVDVKKTGRGFDGKGDITEYEEGKKFDDLFSKLCA
jgi:hypothetical protein